MSDIDLAATARAYLSKWQARLRVSQWTVWVRVVSEGDDEDSLAVVEWEHHYRKATVTVFSKPFEAVRAAQGEQFALGALEFGIAHEMAHLLLAPMKEVLGDQLNHEGDLYRQVRHASESICDHLAGILMDQDRAEGEGR